VFRCFFLLALLSCAHEPRPEPQPAGAPEKEAQEAALARFRDGFVGPKGYVTSYYTDGPRAGERERLGDSTLWTWVAIGALDCQTAAAMVDAQLDLLVSKAGRIDRHDPLRVPGDARTPYSFDQESGWLHGLARHIARCGPSPLVDVAWDTRDAYTAANGGRLHEDPALGRLPAEFTVLRDELAHKLGKGGRPSNARLTSLSAQLAGWLAAVKATRRECYRAHLGWLYVSGLEALGRPLSDEGRAAVCAAADGLSMPVWEHYCGRDDLAAFIRDFRYNQYEYSLQRCAWETPDGLPDLATPGVDLIVAYGLRHGV